MQVDRRRLPAAAENAKRAGFDGVQLTPEQDLIDQFLRDSMPICAMTDMAATPRIARDSLREVLTAIIDVWGKDRVGVRLSPNGETQGCDDSDPATSLPPGAPPGSSRELASTSSRIARAGSGGPFGSTDVPQGQR